MRIALLYPPPWRISVPGALPYMEGGPPEGYRDGDLDADFHQTPYGLFSLGAQAMRAGHSVKLINMSAFVWPRACEVVAALDADVFGMSCWTANRRGVAMVAELIKQLHPKAHVTIGGPHATPLATEILGHWPHVDTVCVGESDGSFMELVTRLSRNESTTGVAGTFYRDGGKIIEAPHRENIKNLDDLASPQDYFDTHILMTSRGCPWNCTFCGAETSWGRGFRSNTVPYTLHAMESVLPRLPVKMIQIKDDTFTTNKKRVIELCRAIRDKGLKFFWSCDTRVDLLTEELLREMRLAGCQRLSLGVESGSQRILNLIDKKITTDEIITSTRLAQKVGIKVRYYMMLGNRGETLESFRETLDFLERARPHEYIFSCLSIYPGTRDFHDAEKAGWLDREVYFSDKFQELKTPFDATADVMTVLNDWFAHNSGLRTLQRDGVKEYEAILAELGDHHAAHMDLGAAYYHAGNYRGAEEHVRKALDLGYPLPGLVYNHLACIAKAIGDVDGMMDLFSEAARVDPQHYVLMQNVNRARQWFKNGGPGKGLPLDLEVRHDFQLFERTMQPTLPGPLPDDFAEWRAPMKIAPAGDIVKTPEQEGSTKPLDDRRRLRIVT